jgi:hypothetical protein
MSTKPAFSSMRTTSSAGTAEPPHMCSRRRKTVERFGSPESRQPPRKAAPPGSSARRTRSKAVAKISRAKNLEAMKAESNAASSVNVLHLLQAQLDAIPDARGGDVGARLQVGGAMRIDAGEA